MDFHHLKYFVEVADQKSFSKAARNLHISQSAISRTIKALEDELGVVLFMRNAKSVELTDGGTIFLTHAKRVVFMFEHLKTDFENEFRLEQGSIRIGIPPITDAPIFAQLLGEFKKVYPQIELELYEQGSKKVEISVQEGLIDIGIICTKPNPKEFESFYLTSDPLSVIIPKSSPLAKEKEIRLEMLADESFVLHKDDFNLHDEIIKACKHTGFQPHIVFETSQRDLMLQTVSANLAIALLPSRLCPEVGENTEVGSKVVVRPLVPEIIHTLYVIWKKGHYLSHASRLWLDFVNSKLPLPGLRTALPIFASKLRALLKAKEAPMWGVIIVLVIVIIFQQIQISELQWRVDEDHDGSTIDSVAGRLYILEGMANKHSDQLDEILKDIRQLQNDGAKYDWELKQLQWLHPELKVQPPEANPRPFKSTDLNLDMNPGKVPDVTKQNQ